MSNLRSRARRTARTHLLLLFFVCLSRASLAGQTSAPDLDALQTRALAEAQAGQTSDAIRDFTVVLASRPEWKEGWWNLGVLQYTANQFADARSTFTRVVGFAPQLGTAWALLGLSEFELKDYSSALAHLEKARSLGMDNDDETKRVAVYHLALLLIRNSSFDSASDLLLSTFPGSAVSPEVRFALGLATLHVPLLPSQIDPSQEAVLSAAGQLASLGEQALPDFPPFLDAHPGLPYAHYAYALLLAKAGRDDEALTQLHSESRLSPGSPPPWQEIARIESRHNRPDAARAATAKVAALSSQRTPTPEPRILARYSATSAGPAAQAGAGQWREAMQQYAAGHYAEVVTDLKPLLQARPGNGTGWAVLGLSEYALHDLDDARLHLERGEALGLSGTPASLREARYTLGILLIRAGEFERASAILLSAQKIFPHDEAIQAALGLALLRRAELPEAIPPASKTLVSTAGELATLLNDSRYDQAFALFKTLLQQYPATPFLHYAYGTALLSLSEFDRAAAEMRAEIALSPGSPLPYLRLASVALRQHTPAEAIAPARKALALSPNSADAHYLLGRALLETGEDPGALHELEIAGKLSPGSPEVHFTLAKAYARARMPEAAATERSTFARLNSLSEHQKKEGGNAIYAGPHDTGAVITQPN